MPDESTPPGEDWHFPPIDPPAEPLLGWTPEPAVPSAVSPVPSAAGFERLGTPLPPAAPTEPAEVPGLQPYPVAPALPSTDIAAEPDPTAEPPSAGVLPVPRRQALGATPVSPLRALAGAAIAVAGVLLGIGALLWATDAPKGSPTLQQTQAQSSVLTPSPEESPRPSPEPVTSAPAVLTSPAASAASKAPAVAPKLALTVLNNSKVTGLAKRAAARYAAQGWPIKDTGSFRGQIPVTTVYYAPGQQASAALLQTQFPGIARVRPRFATLPGSGLTVVLTRDYRA